MKKPITLSWLLATLGVVAGMVAVEGAGQAIAAAKTKVVFATWGTVSDWKPYVDMFHADNPDIEVQVVASAWPTYWQKIDVMLAGTMDVDVVRLGGQHLPTYAQTGALADMGRYFRRDLKTSDFFPGAISGGEYGGVLYALPEHFSPTTGFFNVSMYEEAGLESPYQLWTEGRWTWDEFVAGAKRLTRDTNGDGKIDRFGAWMNYRDQGFWQSLVVSNGGRIYTPDLSRSTLDERPAINALSFLTGLATQHRVMPTEGEAWGAWLDGRVAFTHGAPSYMGGWRNVKFEYDLVPLPIPAGGKETAANVLNLLAITKTSRHPEAAWRFVQYMLSEKVQRARIAQWVIMSARRQIAVETVTGKQLPVAHPAVLVRIAETSFPMQAAPGYIQIDQIIGDALAKVVAGAWPIETAIREQIIPQVNKILADTRK